ncbi:hypothetical protein, partial [Citrobacter werkmanii]|uniref:hypothetical protein n=1 Tax=Citrobacter werkmanii TaxID=67827 RepID=UPI001F278298
LRLADIIEFLLIVDVHSSKISLSINFLIYSSARESNWFIDMSSLSSSESFFIQLTINGLELVISKDEVTSWYK